MNFNELKQDAEKLCKELKLESERKDMENL